MPIYVKLSLLASLFFASSLIINKIIAKDAMKNSNDLMYYFMLSFLPLAIVIYPFTSRTVPDLPSLINVLLATFTFIIGYIFFYKGIQKTDASVFAPLFQLQAVLLAFLAFLFLNERFEKQIYISIAAVISGALFVSYSDKITIKRMFSNGLTFVLLMQLFHAFSNLFIGFSLKTLNFLDIFFWESCLIGSLALIYRCFKAPGKYKKTTLAKFLIGVYLSSLGAMLLFRAYSFNITVPGTLALMSSPIVFVFSVVASRFWPKLIEHNSVKTYIVRGVGVILILIGVMQITT